MDSIEGLDSELLGAIARGWCSPENSHKEMDATLATAIAREVSALSSRQGEAAEHRMMMDDLRLYGMAFSKNGKRIPPEDVYITQPPAPAVGVQIAAPGDVAQRSACDECGGRGWIDDGHEDDYGRVYAAPEDCPTCAAALRSQGQADAVRGVVEALVAAQKSLAAIAKLAGNDEYMDTFTNVRAYANNRALAASTALSHPSIAAIARGEG